ncbi:androglobin-like [Xylocopa sonorina]|uniref:androglobin-like n=1 Tax=Xylocopa sonorina TaxID=1818115 RepID=UPI00403AE295
MSVVSKNVAESAFEVPLTDDTTLWQEWSDATLNKENWTYPKNGPDGLFFDTQVVQLPSSLESHEWIRAKDLENLTGPLTVFVADSTYPDLITNNKHLLHSQFARWFISALINLQYCGQDGLEISGENVGFIWNCRYQSWRGWMNVYSMSKAGKGAQHRPVVNPNGKYIVRLYFLGAWRRIVVDDRIPVNVEKLPLLPRTTNNSELWPMILSKAVLKLCALTWSGSREIVDFHPVACLTGWVCLRLDVGYLSPQDKWDFLRKYADHFEWKAEVTEQESPG